MAPTVSAAKLPHSLWQRSRMDTKPRLQHVGIERELNLWLYVIELKSADELPAAIDIQGKHFTALVVWNSHAAASEIVARFACRLIDLGGVYFCCWGPGCEQVHDTIDEEWLSKAPDAPLMTTWHDDDSLADAICFAIFTAFPSDEFFDDVRSLVAICIDCPQWADEVRDAFRDPSAFSERLIGPDD